MPVAADNGRSHQGALAPLGFYFLACTANLVFAGVCSTVQESQPGLALYGVCVASLVWLVIAWGSWYRATGRLADAYWLLALAVWLFNGGGMALTQVVHPDPDWAFREFVNPVTRRFTLAGVVRAFHFVLFCLSAMHAGALLAVSRRPAGGPVAGKDPSLFWIGVGLLAVSFGPALWMVQVSMARVRAGGYMALYQEDGAGEGLIFMLSSGLVPGAFYLMGSDLDNRWLRRAGAGLVVTFSAAILALGTRALFFQNILALLWLRHFGVRPIRKAVWVGLIAVGLLLSGWVAWSREKARQTELTLSELQPTGNEPNAPGVASSLNEMGTSIMTVVFTMDLVPAVRPFAWGETYLASLEAALPGLDTGRETEEVWLTYLVSPETASVGGGLGFSFMAEAYLNFGIAAPAVLGLAGFFLGGFAGWSHAAGRSGRLAFAACVMSIMLFSARASSLSFVRRVLMLCVIPYAALVVLRFLEARHAGPRLNFGGQTRGCGRNPGTPLRPYAGRRRLDTGAAPVRLLGALSERVRSRPAGGPGAQREGSAGRLEARRRPWRVLRGRPVLPRSLAVPAAPRPGMAGGSGCRWSPRCRRPPWRRADCRRGRKPAAPHGPAVRPGGARRSL